MKKRKLKSALWTIGLLLAAAVLIAIPFFMELGAQASSGGPSILSAQAKTGTIRTDLCGAGTLKEQKALSIEAPDGVKLKEILVKDGQHVNQGEALARIDPVSVMDTISKVQQTLDDLNEQIRDVMDEKESTKLKCRTDGRLIALYCGVGDSVQDVMLDRGALAVVSLDGMLCLSFSCEKDISVGSEVSVILPDGSEVPGRVATSLSGVVSVTLSDEHLCFGQTVRVADQSGTELGKGVVQAHSEWRVLASSGTVKALNADVGDPLGEGDAILTLEDADSAEYDRLCQIHRVYEKMMTELFVLYQERFVYAPDSGFVTLPEDTSAILLASEDQTPTLRLLVNAPMDGSDSYVNYAGVVTGISESGIAVNMRPDPLTAVDYLNVTVSRDEMTVPMVNTADPSVPVFFRVDGTWQQGSLSALAVGDVLLFVYDGETPVWIVRIEHASEEQLEKPDQPAQPQTPDQPELPDQPPLPQTPDLPSMPQMPDPNAGLSFDPNAFLNQIPSNYVFSGPGSAYSGMDVNGQYSSMTEAQEEAARLYTQERTRFMSVTPADTMLLEIRVDELDVLKLSPGQKAEVTVDALPGRSFHTVIDEIVTVGQNAGGSSKYSVRMTLERTGEMLDGMNAAAVIPLDDYENVLLLPVEALVENEAKTCVYRGYDKRTGLTGLTEVQTGVSDARFVEIRAGISAGDTVWYAYYDKLEPSTKVERSKARRFG